MIDASSPWLIAFIIFLFILSAFFSGTETAYSSVNKIRLRKYAEEGNVRAAKALEIAENFHTTITTILIGNNIVNILLTSIVTAIFSQLFGAAGLAYATVTMTVFILIFGEILPKAIGKDYAEFVAMQAVGIMSWFIWLLTPFSFLFNLFQKLLTRYRKIDEQPSVTQEELLTIVDTIQEEGYMDEEERELIQSAIEFDDVFVRDVQTPRVDMFAIDVNDSLDKIVHLLLENQYSRIPVYEETIDNIIGVMIERDLMTALIKRETPVLRDLVRETMFVAEHMTIADALQVMQKQKAHLAIVIDEFGGTSGVITAEDILEQLVGEIYDEYDEVVQLFEQLDEVTWIADGELELEDLFEKHLKYKNIPSSEYNTVAGWVYENSPTVPDNGQRFTYEEFEIEIIDAKNRRINKIKITKQ